MNSNLTPQEKTVLKDFRRVWKLNITDYLYAKDTFDLDLRESVAKDDLEAFLLQTYRKGRTEGFENGLSQGRREATDICKKSIRDMFKENL